MIASGLERVFEIGPAYRAEKHDTPRHINEFVSLDVEMAFIESEQELMDLETRILAAIFRGDQGNEPARPGCLEGGGAGSCAVRADPPGLPRRGQGDRLPGDGQEGLRDQPRRASASLCDWALKNARNRGGVRLCLPAQVTALLYVPRREQQDAVLRPAFPRAGGHLGKHADQPVRHARGEPEDIRPEPGGFPTIFPSSSTAARPMAALPSAGAADAEDPGAGQRQGSDPVPAGQEADQAVARDAALREDGPGLCAARVDRCSERRRIRGPSVHDPLTGRLTCS